MPISQQDRQSQQEKQKTEPKQTKPEVSTDFNQFAAKLTTDLYYAPAGADPSRDLIKKYNLQGPGKTKNNTYHFQAEEETKYGQYPYPVKVDTYGDNGHTHRIMVYNEKTGKPAAQIRNYKAPEGITSEGVEMPRVMVVTTTYDDNGKKDSLDIQTFNDELQNIGERRNIKDPEKGWTTEINLANSDYLATDRKSPEQIHEQNQKITKNTQTPEKEQPKQKPYEKDTSWRDKEPTKRQLDFLSKAGVSGTVGEWRSKTRGEVADEIGKIKKQMTSDIKQAKDSLDKVQANKRNRT